MLFFDLEFYVPPDDRTKNRGSLVVNPSRPKHVLLGGCFFSKRFDAEIPTAPDIESLWLWKHDDSEADLLRAIKSLFEREWTRQVEEGAKILGKRINDLVLCGAGIAKLDLPGLYCRSVLHGIADPAELFELFFKSRPIELSNEASFLFPEEPHLYPKTTKEIAGRLGLKEEKGSSKTVWELYEAKEYEAIEKRTEAELRTVLKIYQGLQSAVKTKKPR